MRILVAGGAGMIGSNLCADLLARGHRVICQDNLATGRLENVVTLGRHPGFTFVRHDILDELPPFPRLGRIYHLASPASPPGYTRLPIETLRTNSEGTRRLLEAARQHGARLLYCSTSEVYGDPEQHPQREEYRGNVSSIGPRSMYDESKRYGEAIVMAFVRHLGVDARIVRIFNTYGPGCDPEDGRVVVNLACQALRGEPMTVYGDGRQTRSLCFVSDMVEGLVRAMESRPARGQVLNLGNPDERTVLELAMLIRELAGSDSPVVYREAAVGDDPRLRRPDITKAVRMLGWEPHVALGDGLARTIAYLRGVLGVPARSAPNGAATHTEPNGTATHPESNGAAARTASNVAADHGATHGGPAPDANGSPEMERPAAARIRRAEADA